MNEASQLSVVLPAVQVILPAVQLVLPAIHFVFACGPFRIYLHSSSSYVESARLIYSTTRLK